MTQTIEEQYLEILAKEIAEDFDYKIYKIITDTPRKQKLRKLLGITDEEYFTRK